MANLAFTFHTIRAQLKRRKDTADGCEGCCPAHDDGDPSLSVKVAGDRILIHCHAGCAPEDILFRLGLEWTDLFADDAKKSKYDRAGPRPLPLPREPEKPPPDFGPLLEDARKLPDHRAHLLRLADSLDILPESREAWLDAADRVGTVYLPKHLIKKHFPKLASNWFACWGFHERDASGKVIGITRRYADGKKKDFPDGKRGLYFDPNRGPADGEQVYTPEGPTDTIAMLACGLCSVGRPSNTGGVSLLIDLLGGEQEIIVLGENDQKPDGKWPGREGMERTAAALAQALPSCSVYAAMTPDGCKDARVWIDGRAGAGPGADFVVALERTRIPYRDEATSNTGNARTDTGVQVPIDLAPLLDGLADPPPPSACPRSMPDLQQHLEDPTRFRTCRYACDGHDCPACCRRMASEWAIHLCGCMREADAAGYVFGTAVVAESQLESIKHAVRERKGKWFALELDRGLYCIVGAIPADRSMPERLLPVTLQEAAARLVEWATAARPGRHRPKTEGGKRRPAQTCVPWQMSRPIPPPQWRRVVDRVRSQDIDEVLSIVLEEGGRLRTPPGRDDGDGSGPAGPLIWSLEWHADPETAARITERLRALGGAKPAPPRPPDDDDDPFADPLPPDKPWIE